MVSPESELKCGYAVAQIRLKGAVRKKATGHRSQVTVRMKKSSLAVARSR
jgi:hypothetical protein